MYIDGIFSGGGIKGIGLVGAYQVLEEKGYRLKRVAGTSAGAILACFIAAGYNGREMEELMMSQNFQKLLDPRKTVIPLPFMKWLNLYWGLGIYQGKALEDWFLEKLAYKGIYTFGDLPPGSLKLVASDLTNGKMIVLPDDLKNYGIEPDTFLVSRALRMSCGIPFFFEPIKLKSSVGDVVVVDGGVLSNFPMWIFENGLKERPVLGIRLSANIEEPQPKQIKNGLDLFESLFTTMKDAHDTRYISRKIERNIIFIPADEYNATQFELDYDSKLDLLQKGRESTTRFLKTW